ncbi:RNA polymerase sigma factor [Sphingobium sp. HWE2-09]|uniref:RNA polymerase sigma factor n=1 Tax=Sphingobium sp. HWE2-09 TaxID=3108390 RepID=UPI002DCD08C8|nr:RNA polymerase sigma factor [Sphingobium sp. HWE2-09]
MDDPSEKTRWFQDVILPSRGLLRRRLRKILPGHMDLDDIVAEVLMRAYAVDDWRQIRNGLAFMHRIARNLLIDQARREAIISFDYMADLDDLGKTVSYDGMLNARDELRRLENLVKKLPMQQRRAFMLRRVEEYSVADVAAEMGLSVSTVENHLSRALASIARGTMDSENHDAEHTPARQNTKTENRGGSRASGRPA